MLRMGETIKNYKYFNKLVFSSLPTQNLVMLQASPYKRSHNRIHSGQGLLRGVTVGG